MVKTLSAAALACASVAALSGALGPTSLAASRHRSCDAHRAYRKTASVLVFRKPSGRQDSVGDPLTIYYACSRPAGKAHQVALDAPSGGEYSSNDVLNQLEIAGRYAGSLVTTGAGDSEVCSKYQQARCPTAAVILTVLDTRSGRAAGLTLPLGSARLTLSPAGAVGWTVPVTGGASQLYATALGPAVGRGRLGADPRVLDAGNIAAVSFSGLTLQWTKDGQRRSALLARP